MFGHYFHLLYSNIFFWWGFFNCPLFFHSFLPFRFLNGVSGLELDSFLLSHSWKWWGFPGQAICRRFMQKAIVDQFCTGKILSWFRVLHENQLVFYFSTFRGDRQPWGFSKASISSPTATDTDKMQKWLVCMTPCLASPSQLLKTKPDAGQLLPLA